jgi:hypothetical protein
VDTVAAAAAAVTAAAAAVDENAGKPFTVVTPNYIYVNQITGVAFGQHPFFL